MQINLIDCKTEDEEKEIIELLKIRYKNNPNCKFREISDTFILPDKKWIITPHYLIKQLTKRKTDNKVYTAEQIKNALEKEKQRGE